MFDIDRSDIELVDMPSDLADMLISTAVQDRVMTPSLLLERVLLHAMGDPIAKLDASLGRSYTQPDPAPAPIAAAAPPSGAPCRHGGQCSTPFFWRGLLRCGCTARAA